MKKNLTILFLFVSLIMALNYRVPKSEYSLVVSKNHELSSEIVSCRNSFEKAQSKYELNQHIMQLIESDINWNESEYTKTFPYEILVDYYSFQHEHKIKFRNPVFRRINPKYFEVALEVNDLFDSELFWEHKKLVIVIDDDGGYRVFDKHD